MDVQEILGTRPTQISDLAALLADPEKAKRQINELILRAELLETAKKEALAVIAESNDAAARAKKEREEAAAALAKYEKLKAEVDDGLTKVALGKHEISERERALLRADEQIQAEARAMGAALEKREQAVAVREGSIGDKEAAVESLRAMLQSKLDRIRAIGFE